jgi:predicted anti-sigma-YlaC factor YlaD
MFVRQPAPRASRKIILLVAMLISRMFVRRLICPLVLLATLGALSGCSLKTVAVKTVANTLSESGDVFSRDDDPDLIREAIPFALKLNESLLESVPTHAPLLLSTCSSFTQYSFAFVETEADVVGTARYEESKALLARALKLYLRGRSYCLRAMDVRFPGASEKLLQDPAALLVKAKPADVPLLYWMATSWGAAIALGIDRPDLAIDLPSVRAIADRAIALDPNWSKGALHELMISLDSLPEALGGSVDRARQHFQKAVELQKGLSPGPYVSLATGVAVATQDRAEYERLLKAAIAIDPEKDPSNRLATLVTQRRARALLDQVDKKFSK